MYFAHVTCTRNRYIRPVLSTYQPDLPFMRHILAMQNCTYLFLWHFEFNFSRHEFHFPFKHSDPKPMQIINWKIGRLWISMGFLVEHWNTLMQSKSKKIQRKIPNCEKETYNENFSSQRDSWKTRHFVTTETSKIQKSYSFNNKWTR